MVDYTRPRLYATVNYLCFYANIFRWETSVALRWKDVNGLTKEKTALVIPNAIQVKFRIVANTFRITAKSNYDPDVICKMAQNQKKN